MRIRIQWSSAGLFVVFMLITASFGGLAGFFSLWLSFFLPVYALLTLIYIAISWHFYAWTQTFSTNHPQKGERIRLHLKLVNDGSIPLIGGICRLVMPGASSDVKLPIGGLPGIQKDVEYNADIFCPYRGTYIAGMERVILTSPLGIIRTEIQVQPQMFYVYPEICPLPDSIEKYAVSIGSSLPGIGRGETDPSVFEYVVPLDDATAGSRIAWKRWAATGVPSVVYNGCAQTHGLTVILDLFSCSAENDSERLAAEDMIMSAVFSVVRTLAIHGIPVTFVTGGSHGGTVISSEGDFKQLYERSPGIIFNDNAFPVSAFLGDAATILFSTRPIDSLYQEYDRTLRAGCEPGLFLCPPLSQLHDEQSRADVIAEQRRNRACRSLFTLADVRNGSKEITDAFAR